ncbi:ste ste11 protein kinase [Nannochloropsis oceanica]
MGAEEVQPDDPSSNNSSNSTTPINVTLFQGDSSGRSSSGLSAAARTRRRLLNATSLYTCGAERVGAERVRVGARAGAGEGSRSVSLYNSVQQQPPPPPPSSSPSPSSPPPPPPPQQQQQQLQSSPRFYPRSPPAPVPYYASPFTGPATAFSLLRSPPPTLSRSRSYGGESPGNQLARGSAFGAGGNCSDSSSSNSSSNNQSLMAVGLAGAGISPNVTRAPFATSFSASAGDGGGGVNSGEREGGSAPTDALAPTTTSSATRAFFPEVEATGLSSRHLHHLLQQQGTCRSNSPSHSDQDGGGGGGGSLNNNSSSSRQSGREGKESSSSPTVALAALAGPSTRTGLLPQPPPSSSTPSSIEINPSPCNPFGYSDSAVCSNGSNTRGSTSGNQSHVGVPVPTPSSVPSSVSSSSLPLHHFMGGRSPMVQAREMAVAQIQQHQQHQQHYHHHHQQQQQQGSLPLAYMSQFSSTGSLNSHGGERDGVREGGGGSGDESSDKGGGGGGGGMPNHNSGNSMSALYMRRRSRSTSSNASSSSLSSSSSFSGAPGTGVGGGGDVNLTTATSSGSIGGGVSRSSSRGSMSGKDDTLLSSTKSRSSSFVRGGMLGSAVDTTEGGGGESWLLSGNGSTNSTNISSSTSCDGGGLSYLLSSTKTKQSATSKAFKQNRDNSLSGGEGGTREGRGGRMKDAARRYNDRILAQRLEEAMSFGRKSAGLVGGSSSSSSSSDSRGGGLRVPYEFGLWKTGVGSHSSGRSRRSSSSSSSRRQHHPSVSRLSGKKEEEDDDGEKAAGEEEDCLSTSSSNNGLESSQESVDMLPAATVDFTPLSVFGLNEGRGREEGNEAMNISLGGAGGSGDEEEGHDDVEDEDEDKGEGRGESGGIGRGMIKTLAFIPDEEQKLWSMAGRTHSHDMQHQYQYHHHDNGGEEYGEEGETLEPGRSSRSGGGSSSSSSSLRTTRGGQGRSQLLQGGKGGMVDGEPFEEEILHATVKNNQEKDKDEDGQHPHHQPVEKASMDGEGQEGGDGGERIDWRKGAQIGKGTFGNVFVGLNASTGERFAVKQIGLVDGSRGEVARLEKEILLMKRLRHKHIVRYLGTAHDPHALYIFMEYVPGGSIASMLGQYGAFGEALTRRLVAQIVSGVAYLHSMGIIHRDVKGANVLVTNNGIAKLADFGCSRQLQDLQTSASASLEHSLKNITGSVPWMAPEVIKQTGRLPRAADIWSLGATIIEMATAAHPWPQFSNQLAALFHVATATQPPALPASMSKIGKDFMSRCLAINEAERATAQELLRHPFIAKEVASEDREEAAGCTGEGIGGGWGGLTVREEGVQAQVSPSKRVGMVVQEDSKKGGKGGMGWGNEEPTELFASSLNLGKKR